MKHLHLLMMAITLAIFIYQVWRVFSGKSGRLTKPWMIASHTVYTLLILSGGMMAYRLAPVIGVPLWIIAKIVLLVVAISATIKATRQTANNTQAKAGMVIAAFAYIGIVALAILKPTVGMVGG